MTNDNHPSLFNVDPQWKEMWVGMPEFEQNKKRPFAQIIVRFETEADLKSFEQAVNQKITQKTKSIWHPFKSHWGNSERKVWR